MSEERTQHDLKISAVAHESVEAPSRMLNNVGHVIAGLAVVAGIWTVAQFWIAREQVSADELRLPALAVYVAGLGYLVLTAAVSWPASRAGRVDQLHAGIGSVALWIAHGLVIASAIIIAWRGVAARGLLVGLGGALMAWGVVAFLAVVFEAAVLFVGWRLPTAIESDANRLLRRARIAPACLACAAALGLGLAFLETRPLPNTESPGTTSRSEPASDDGDVARQDATVRNADEG